MSKQGPPCVKCGHSPGYHGMTWCVHDSGGTNKRRCDCDGYVPLLATSPVSEIVAHSALQRMAFVVGDDYRCPKCHEPMVLGYYFRTPEGSHQHTHYVCTAWPSKGSRCGWHDWSIPA